MKIIKENKVFYPNGVEVPDDSVDMDKALDFMYGTDRDNNIKSYTQSEKQRAINYWIKKTDGILKEEYDHSKSELENKVWDIQNNEYNNGFIDDIIEDVIGHWPDYETEHISDEDAKEILSRYKETGGVNLNPKEFLEKVTSSIEGVEGVIYVSTLDHSLNIRSIPSVFTVSMKDGKEYQFQIFLNN